ncbi:MAG: DNA recombination protein RmuC [Paucibacter sp.]|nr:DNA recombination protein RmuC [Roseateles sp.]
MSIVDIVFLAGLALVIVLLLILLARSRHAGEGADLGALVAQSSERLERSLRDELTRNSSGMRQELLGQLAQFQQTLMAQSGDVARTQNEQIDSFRTQLASLQQSLSGAALAAREAQDQAMLRLTDAMRERLSAMQQDNEKKLEQMRATVDEKLHATLEQRLGESFKQVAERLEQVHKGLGEMQGLARDVGSLNRVLTNVKTRGTFGETQLAALLEQVFTPEQYGANVSTLPGSNNRVDFAIRLPGQRGDGAPLWLPIDAKFPREDYERLVDAQEKGDPAGAEQAAKAIETRLRLEAASIREKYVAPPHTTDFAILFVPTEGLYAEALRRPGLVQALQQEHKVMLAGPTTLLATLNSLQMGFRTLALERRSAEVWDVLGAVKTEFAKFGEVLAKTKKKLEEASNTIDAAEVRTRAMTRKLKGVEALPESTAGTLLQLGGSSEAEVDEGEA